jgi:hypothetical protein
MSRLAWLAGVFVVLCGSPELLAQPRFTIAPTSSYTVRAGSVFEYQHEMVNQGSAFTGTVRVIMDITAGGRYIGPTVITPLSIGDCGGLDQSRVCTGRGITIRSGESIIARQGIAIALDAPSVVKHRVRLELTPPGAQPVIVIDSTIDLLVTQAAAVIVSSFPTGMAQATGAAGGSDQLVLTNVGSAPSSVSLTTNGNFFTISPASFSLLPGASQRVAITGLPQPQGFYSGSISATGDGVAPGAAVRVRLISANRPSSPPEPQPLSNRVDLESREGAGQPLQATVQLTNRKSGTVRGVFTSDAPWIIAPEELFIMNAGETKTVTFTVDPSRRPSGLNIGSLAGKLTLRYLLSTAAKSEGKEIAPFESAGTSTVSVGVVSTVAPAASGSTLPPLGAGEVALVVPGVGHIQGSVGVFISDIAISNLVATAPVSNLNLYYTGLAGTATKKSTIGSVPAELPTAFADIVKTVFGESAQVGSLQVRTPTPDLVGISGNVFNSSNASGTYGTAIPVFRSDRSAAAGSRIHLTGLRKDATNHTNLYVQETQGAAATVRVDYYSAGGSVIGNRLVTLQPFGLAQINDALPEGAVSAVLSHESGSAGRIAAYATPVDRASGDTWAIADWGRQYAYTTTTTVVVPVAGASRGANNTYFRTDLALMNRGASTANGTLRFHGRNGELVERSISLSGFETRVISDVTTTFFGLGDGAVGYILYVPGSGDVVITSRTYTTVSGAAATFGTAVPTVPASYALRAGQARRFGGFSDAAQATIVAARPGTFRTNLGLLEVSGQPAVVRATLRYTIPGELSAAIGTASADFSLNARQFLLISNIATAVLGSRRENYDDLTNLQVDLEVISGNGQVIPFLSSVDNGTGDSISRTE